MLVKAIVDANSQRYPVNFLLRKNKEDIVVFLFGKVLNSVNFSECFYCINPLVTFKVPLMEKQGTYHIFIMFAQTKV